MKIRLTLKNYRCFTDAQPATIDFCPGLTALIGPNNAGKSALLRFFYEFRDLFTRLHDEDALYVSPLAQNGFTYPAPVRDPSALFARANNRDLCIRLEVLPESDPSTPLSVARAHKAPLASALDVCIPRGTNVTTRQLFCQGTPVVVPHEAFLEKGVVRKGADLLVDVSLIREASAILADTLYLPAFRNAINVGGTSTYFDMAVGEDFAKLWKQRKVGDNHADNEDAWKVTDDIRRILGFKSLDINPGEKDKSIKLLIDGRSYNLDEVGSGVAQFIITFATAAIMRPGHLLIDEPELGLHPSLQLDFLSALASYATHGVLLATHSIGLARSACDRIYSVVQNDDGTSCIAPYEATTRLPELLGSLGYSGYAALGFEKVLLVEGATDVRVVQQFLRCYRKEHQVVLLSLGGGGMIHGKRGDELAEVQRICPNVVALIDSERVADGVALRAERQEFVDLCGKLGIRCHVMERRATENYFTERALRRILGEGARALSSFEDRVDGPIRQIPKHDNWLVAREMSKEELDDTDVGRFLADL